MQYPDFNSTAEESTNKQQNANNSSTFSILDTVRSEFEIIQNNLKLIILVDKDWLRGLDLNYHIRLRNLLITGHFIKLLNYSGHNLGKVKLFTTRIYNATCRTHYYFKYSLQIV